MTFLSPDKLFQGQKSAHLQPSNNATSYAETCLTGTTPSSDIFYRYI